MRAFLFIAVLSMIAAIALPITSAAAQGLGLSLSDDNKKERAEAQTQQFYEQCIERPIIAMSDTSEQAFCACSAANLQKWLLKPAKDSETSNFLGAPVKELDKLTLFTQVYGSCLYIPAYEMTYRECVTNDRNAYFMKSSQELEMLCQCLAAGDESYFMRFAQPYLEMRVNDGRDFDDPIHEITKSSDFNSAHFALETNCHQDIRRARGK